MTAGSRFLACSGAFAGRAALRKEPKAVCNASLMVGRTVAVAPSVCVTSAAHRASPWRLSRRFRGSQAARNTRVAGAGQLASGGGNAATAGEDPSLAAWWQRQRERERGRGSALSADTAVRLSAELEARAAELTPSAGHVDQREAFLSALQLHVGDVIDGAEVLAFGSAVNGLWTPHSDVDVCVRVPGATTRSAQIRALQQIAGELRRSKTHKVEPRFGAQVPILRWAPVRPGMVACDVSVNNILAVANSRLLGAYSALDPRVRVLGLCLKAWAQARGINDRSRGTLSSFAIALMLIHFLQRRSPPILPSLQDIAFSRCHPPALVSGVDCRYATDAAQISEELSDLRAGQAPNNESVGQLLVEFMWHFGHAYRHGIIRIRDTRSLLPPGDESGCYLVVDNPFEPGKDVANVDSSHHDTIRKEFRRARSLMVQGRSFNDVLRPVEESLCGHRVSLR
eukprot:TRINITY_DN63795_c0_g1_i1.p1 TRINITY_DN63795_c0_g1~~TRINITY_DN63795_c0_g1_i1.p1  ORF type:complete len:470 (-),score=53.26 TRINITY_DN63795_c0_g1_i1:216-1580(-)